MRKQKNLKFLTLILLTLSLTLITFRTCYAEEFTNYDISAEEAISLDRFNSKFVVQQERSCRTFEKIKDLLLSDSLLLEDIPHNRKNYNKLTFTNDYGGSYINEKGDLVVYLKEENTNSQRLLKEIDKNIIIKPSQYSFRELMDIMNHINDYKQKNNNEFSQEFNYYEISDCENRVIVELKRLSDENIAEFKERVCNSEAIIFRQSQSDGCEETNINAGSKVTSLGSSASMGYRVRRNGVNGMVTAAHFVKDGALVWKDGVRIGHCVTSIYSGSVDAAFVNITNGQPSNIIDGAGKELSVLIKEPVAGSLVTKRGMKTGTTSGKIVSTNASWSVNGTVFTNLTSATYSSNNGDSGGVVYSYDSSTGNRYTLGIHKGRNGGKAIFIKANKINNALGTRRY